MSTRLIWTLSLAVLGRAPVPDPLPPVSCKELKVQEDFDLDKYISKKWYAQWQNEQWYQPKDELKCVRAEYEQLKEETSMDKFKMFIGWDIDVKNKANTTRNDGDTDGYLCAKRVTGAKLVVAPCWSLPCFGGDYWVVAYDEMRGYALVAGGQPNKPTSDGKCLYWEDSRRGLWILTREQFPLDDLIKDVKEIAKDRGLDTEQMLKVEQKNCPM
eukprot:CAMPEP_0171098746 /NCGR_PEP_ID=MMETSP0766_2-20121228/49305_1 /TAXON_ID=439317 /ORGANISM="Gambierdiscus australes, Strain CAWD 149" /LENGTH=213 /DNA_ID=CAMNT_0011558175 /DNA_START=46 /DNA_END=687 /DNA_ORIENTATION=+